MVDASLNPFAPPAEDRHLDGLFVSRPGVEGPWRDAAGHVVAKQGSGWPRRCIRCGSTHDLVGVPHSYKRPTRWGPLLVPLTYGAYLSLYLAERPSVVVRPFLCPRHRVESLGTRVGWWVGLALWMVSAVLAVTTLGSPVAGAILGGTATLWALWMPSTVLRASRMEGRVVYLAGAHSRFVRTLPPASSEDVELLYADVPDLG